MYLVQGLAVSALLVFSEYPLWLCALPVVLAALAPTLIDLSDKLFFGQAPAAAPARQRAVKPKDDDENKPPLSVVFASQTGNAELYAKNLAREAKKVGYKVRVHDTADYDVDSLHEETFCVFIVSTYGEGEPTDTSKEFYDWLMSEDRADDANRLDKMKYAVFGLGDSQYKHFCQMGIEFDQRLGELGAQRVHKVGKGDADANMEEEFDSWKQDLWQRTTSLFGLEAKDEFAEPPERQTMLKNHPPPKDTPSPFPVTSSSLPPTQRLPCWGTITRNDELLRNASDRSTRHIEIDCSGSALPPYEAGDHLGIMPANDDAVVAEYMALLGVNASDRDALSLVSAEGLSTRNQLPNKVDAKTALKWYFDLQGVPKKSVLRTFTHYTEDEAERDAFRALLRVNDESSEKYHAAVKKARTVAGFLKMFPSTRVPLDVFFENMPRIQPRWYSIASDSLQHGKVVHICLAISEGGLCSGYLHHMPVGQKVPCFIRKSTFHLPVRDKKRPMIMVGPGTGVAPMIGFLHRKLRWQDQGHELGPCRFYFGCRKQAEDYIYSELMESCKAKGVISDLRVAFSRDQAEKVYVQHLLAEDAQAVWDVVSNGGNIYICGDAKHMARAVEEAILDAMVSKGGMSKPDAEALLNKLEKSQRYLKDVWTSH